MTHANTNKKHRPCLHQDDIHISFAGGAILSFYNVGVATYLMRNTPISKLGAVHGVSGGALCGAWLLCAPSTHAFGLINEQYVGEWEAKVKREGGPRALKNSLAYHRSLLERLLPQDAHLTCSGRLHIALTRVSKVRHEIISHFETRKHLIDLLIAAMSIPGVNCLKPAQVKGRSYYDGGLVRNQVVCCEDVICVTPFDRLFSVRPMAHKPKNLIRGCRPTLDAFNPNTNCRENLELGYQDAKTYFEARPEIFFGQPESNLISMEPHRHDKASKATERLASMH